MILSLHIQNFQSHSDSFLEFATTVTAIVGANNHGKSAIIRALEKVFRNEPEGTSFVRDGAVACSIRIDTDRGYVTRNIRTDKVSNSNEYIVNDVEFNKFGHSGIPEEVLTVLGISPVQVFGDETFDLNFQHQLDPLFLVSGTGLPSLRGKILGKVTGVDRAQRAVQLVGADVKKTKSDISALQKLEIDALEYEKKRFEVVPVLVSELEEIKQAYQQVESQIDSITSLQDYFEKLKTISLVAKNCKRVVTLTSEDFSSYERLPGLARAISFLEELQSAESRINYLEQIASIDTDIDLTSLQVAVKTISWLRTLEGVETAFQRVESRLHATKSIPELISLTEIVGKWKDLRGLQDKLVAIDHSITASMQAAEESVEKEQELHTQLHELEEKLGVCPLCERAFA